MKKIRILTFIDKLDNYGQVLQAYALQRFLRNNYSQFDIKIFYIFAFSYPKSLKGKIHAKLKNAERVVRTYFRAYVMRNKKYIKKLKNNPLITKFNATRNFVNFKKEYLALHCDEMQDFMGYTDELNAECYIVGSDQVWNGGDLKKEHFKDGKHWLDFYTLNFLPKDNTARKISYAASLGKREFASDFEKWYFKDALAKFDAISVRESCNIKTLAELDLKSICVPDPTQLLSKNDYEKLINLANIDKQISNAKVRKDSVFVYMLGNETSADKDEIMNFLQGKFGENAVIYTNANVDFSCASDYECDFAPTPQEWLACVRDCKLMITNSFHGCAFAITMNTPFVALKLGGGASPMNTRFEQLLGLFDLQNRLVSNLEELKAIVNSTLNKNVCGEIAWDKINAKLAKWRNVGINFLAENLKDL